MKPALETHRTYDNSLFGMPPCEKEEIVIIPITWDVTTSFLQGASLAPEAILKISSQMDFFHPEWKNLDVKMLPINKNLKKQNRILKKKAQKIYNHLEKHETLTPQIQKLQEQVNEGSRELNKFVYEESLKALNKNLKVGALGGDHSSPLGLIQALSEKYKDEGFGILHIDAHADLRDAYCGFEYSHASIMDQVLKLPHSPERITQVALRDMSPSEYQRTQNDSRLTLYSDDLLRAKKAEGETWKKISLEILDTLPQNVYISLDVDGLEPSLAPDTGTLVPGGLSYHEFMYLLELLAGLHETLGKKIIGFDLSEVRPVKHTMINEVVGARLLLQLSAWLQNQKN